MAERIMISAEPRQVIGKQVKQLRRTGWIPAVIYGQADPVHIQLENLSLRRVMRAAGMNTLIDIDLGGVPRTVVAREIQRHPVRDQLYHVDFYEVNLLEKITAEVELVPTGRALPEAEGLGNAILVLRTVEIEMLPGDLVSELSVDLSAIRRPDDVVHVRDLALPPGVVILTDGDNLVARFELMAPEEVEEEEFAPSADMVEVIARGKPEEFED